jgi:Leucine-rich repeat (LRR) protein
MSGGGSKEEHEKQQELLSIETYSGKEIGQIKSDATKDEIQVFIQKTTDNKSHVRFMRTKDTVLFGFIDNRHILMEWEKADEYGWSLEIDTSEWELCTFEGTTLIELDCSYNQLTELPDLRQCVSLVKLYCFNNQLTELPDLSKCVSLKELDCSDNQLTELPDLSKCVSLVDLYCYNNQLTEELKVPSGTKVYK